MDKKRGNPLSNVKSPRAIVSVAFSKEEFERVSDAAGERRLSTFIREAAVFMARMKQYENKHYGVTTSNPDAIVTTNG